MSGPWYAAYVSSAADSRGNQAVCGEFGVGRSYSIAIDAAAPGQFAISRETISDPQGAVDDHATDLGDYLSVKRRKTVTLEAQKHQKWPSSIGMFDPAILVMFLTK